MKKKTVKKGKHGSRPFTFNSTTDSIEWRIALNNTMIYDHGDRDQLDWNKLCGLKFKYFKPHWNTVMVGWRWSLQRKAFKFNIYQHRDNKTVMGDIMFMAKPNDTLGIQMKRTHADTIRVTMWIVGEMLATRKVTDVTLTKEATQRVKMYEILHWFGGTKPAPHNVAFNYLRLIKY